MVGLDDGTQHVLLTGLPVPGPLIPDETGGSLAMTDNHLLWSASGFAMRLQVDNAELEFTQAQEHLAHFGDGVLVGHRLYQGWPGIVRDARIGTFSREGPTTGGRGWLYDLAWRRDEDREQWPRVRRRVPHTGAVTRTWELEENPNWVTLSVVDERLAVFVESDSTSKSLAVVDLASGQTLRRFPLVVGGILGPACTTGTR